MKIVIIEADSLSLDGTARDARDVPRAGDGDEGVHAQRPEGTVKMPKAFRGFPPDTVVEDVGYGRGVVVRRDFRKRRLIVRMHDGGDVWEYDSAHVRAFLRRVKP